jgi:hypothetical protein
LSLSLRPPQKNPVQLSPPPYAPHAPPISFFSLLPPAQYRARSTDPFLSSYKKEEEEEEKRKVDLQ